MTDLETRPAPPESALRRAAPALLGYAAVRALGLLTLALWTEARDKSAYTLLTARWDALWYTRVAELGYGYEVRLPNGDIHSNLAFFPLLPWLERGLAAVSPLSYADAGFVVSLLASPAAAWGIFAVADHVYGRRAGVCAVLVWAVLPVGIVQSMAYSESLFTALAAWSLYAVLTGRWLTAGALAGLAGLTRPVGLAVVAAVWVAGIAAFMRDRAAAGAPSSERERSAARAGGAGVGERAPEPATDSTDRRAPTTDSAHHSPSAPRVTADTPDPRAAHTPTDIPAPAAPRPTSTTSDPQLPAPEGTHAPRAPRPVAGAAAAPVPDPQQPSATHSSGPRPPASDGARPLSRTLGMLLAPLGAAGYVLWVGHHTGKGPLGYLDVQAGWRNGFDGGYAFARFVGEKFTSFPSALAGVGLIIGVGLVVWLYVVGVRQRQPLPLLVYTGVVTALALCASSYFGSKPRLLLPAFPLLFPLALTLARLRTSRSALVVGGIALASAVYGAFWLNGSGPP